LSYGRGRATDQFSLSWDPKFVPARSSLRVHPNLYTDDQ